MNWRRLNGPSGRGSGTPISARPLAWLRATASDGGLSVGGTDEEAAWLLLAAVVKFGLVRLGKKP